MPRNRAPRKGAEAHEAEGPEQARAVLALLPEGGCDREHWHSHTVVRKAGADVTYRIHCKAGATHAVAVQRSELRKTLGHGHGPQVWFVVDPDSEEEPRGIELPDHPFHNPMRFPVVD